MATASDNLRLLMKEIAGASWDAATAGRSREAVEFMAIDAADLVLEKIRFVRENDRPKNCTCMGNLAPAGEEHTSHCPAR